MFDPGEPASGGEYRASLAQLHRASLAYLEPLPAAEFFAPQGTAWSPAEHVRHLAKSARPLARALGWPRLGLRIAFGQHPGPSRPFAALRSNYQARLAQGAQAGRFAPRPRPMPSDLEVGRRAVLAEWSAAVAAVDTAMGRWPESGLDRYQLPHPLLGRLTVREMMAFTVYHTAHHLRRVAERRAAMRVT